MSDYIERDKAFNAILNLVPKVDDDGYCWVIRGDAAKAIDSIPAVDVRPVVLCLDCKYGQGAKMDFWNEYEGIECIGGVVHRKDWFCADGEKREES